MPEIDIRLEGLDQAVERLRAVPDASRFCIQQAVLHCLRRGRTEAGKIARTRYNISLAAIRSAIGAPRLSGGLSGFMKISGSKFPLSMFPHTLFEGRGIEIQELREGPPISLRHAFNERIFERTSPQVKRLPIMRMAGLSVPEMFGPGRKQEVSDRLRAVLEADAAVELSRLVRGVLNGSIKAK